MMDGVMDVRAVVGEISWATMETLGGVMNIQVVIQAPQASGTVIKCAVDVVEGIRKIPNGFLGM